MSVTTIEVTYRVTTPLFCGGADPDRDPEIRLPSFKGVLRYWWRALAWTRHGGDLREVQQEEDEIFGSAGGGQSRVSMRLTPGPVTSVRQIRAGQVLRAGEHGSSRRTVGDGARYFGYGVMEAFRSKKKGTKPGQLTRPCLKAPFEISVTLRVRGLAPAQLELLTKALVTLGTIGGMGAKSRKGYGSLATKTLCVNGASQPVPQSKSELQRENRRSVPRSRSRGGSGVHGVL